MSAHPLGEFSLFAWVKHRILGVIRQFFFALGIGFSHWWSRRVCCLTGNCSCSLLVFCLAE